MRKHLLILALLLSLSVFTMGAMNPVPAYCQHQNYTFNDSEYRCYFTDYTSCPGKAFYNGSCGQEFVREIPCREEGEPVFSQFEDCCDGLEPFVEYGAIGQTTCVPEEEAQTSIWKKIKIWYRMLVSSF